MGNAGKWSLVIGLGVAIITGLLFPIIYTFGIGGMGRILAIFSLLLKWLLIIFGLVVGFLNIKEKETTAFLVTTMALMMIGVAVLFAQITPAIGLVFANIIALVAPAALVVSFKAIVDLCK